MGEIAIATDSYERKARLYPALLLIAPVVATGAAILAAQTSAIQTLAGVGVACGGAFLLTQLARDAGKKGENALFEKWGGVPSVAIFRHRDGTLDAITKARYHARLAACVQGTKAPSADDEGADQGAADSVYTAWSSYLRAATRDTKKYSLLFKENVNYGFRRNVWGLRSAGIVASLLCSVIAAARLYRLPGLPLSVENAGMTGALAMSLVFFALWTFRFTSEWVRVPAWEYAKRLAEAAETLAPQQAAP
jgi:hypothetical protein